MYVYRIHTVSIDRMQKTEIMDNIWYDDYVLTLFINANPEYFYPWTMMMLKHTRSLPLFHSGSSSRSLANHTERTINFWQCTQAMCSLSDFGLVRFFSFGAFWFSGVHAWFRKLCCFFFSFLFRTLPAFYRLLICACIFLVLF